MAVTAVTGTAMAGPAMAEAGTAGERSRSGHAVRGPDYFKICTNFEIVVTACLPVVRRAFDVFQL